MHGSVPKTVFRAETLHDDFPTQARCTTAVEFKYSQVGFRTNEPQLPVGSPKDANWTCRKTYPLGAVSVSVEYSGTLPQTISTRKAI